MAGDQFLLSGRQHDALYRFIEADHFSQTTPVDRPVAVILGGQPGAGKSRLLEACKADFAGGNVVSINGDELRYYHPQYRQIQKADERHFAELTDPHARPWTKQLFDRTIETRRNVVFEGTMREPGPITDTMRTLRAEGYQVVVRVIASNAADSMTGIHRRYEEQKAARGFGRWTPAASHDAAYAGMPATVGYIECKRLADRLEVFDRAGQLLYANRLADGHWAETPAAPAAIAAERALPVTADTLRQREAEWSDIFRLMAERRASADEFAMARQAAQVYVGLSPAVLERTAAKYERLDSMPNRAAPEVLPAQTEKAYRGPIVLITEQMVLQSVQEQGREVHVRHDRTSLNYRGGTLPTPGTQVEIRYPLARIGIVKDLERTSPVSRGIAPQDFER